MDYEFIVTSNDPDNASQNTRQVVRRRASQAAARTRRREARFIKVNQLQMPVWLEADLAVSSARSTDPLSLQPSEHFRKRLSAFPMYLLIYFDETGPLAQSIPHTLPSNPPQSLLPIRELLEFSKHDMLTTLLSHDELSPIFLDPLRIQKVLSLMHRQFFSGLGEGHETNQCVKNAVACLWAYLEQLIVPGLSPARINKHVECYVQALSSIRSALHVGSALDSTDVWFATLILILYEVKLPKLLLD